VQTGFAVRGVSRERLNEGGEELREVAVWVVV
jgi:hypothetical protein